MIASFFSAIWTYLIAMPAAAACGVFILELIGGLNLAKWLRTKAPILKWINNLPWNKTSS